MNRIFAALLGATATAIVAATANAADMPVKAPAVVPILRYNWSGCYIGGHAGGGWARTEWTNTVNTTTFTDFNLGEGFTQSDSGFIGGGQLGCNYQTGPWVFGIEGTISGSSIKGDTTTISAVTNEDAVFTTKVTTIATVTGRLGYAWDNWLLYAKGGYAGADIKFSVSDPANSIFGSESDWHNGWTVGGGVEYGLTPNWIIGLEYDFLDLERRSHELGGGAGFFTFDGRPQIHEVLARVSYKFW